MMLSFSDPLNVQCTEWLIPDLISLHFVHRILCLFMVQELPANSIVVLHAVAHNPTGCDPTKEQWKEMCDVLGKRGCTVMFDSAYQGFATGDCDADAFAPRYFRNEGKLKNLMLAQSFAKNMGLYGQRVGVVSVDCNGKVFWSFLDALSL